MHNIAAQHCRTTSDNASALFSKGKKNEQRCGYGYMLRNGRSMLPYANESDMRTIHAVESSWVVRWLGIRPVVCFIAEVHGMGQGVLCNCNFLKQLVRVLVNIP